MSSWAEYAMPPKVAQGKPSRILIRAAQTDPLPRFRTPCVTQKGRILNHANGTLMPVRTQSYICWREI